VHERTHPGANRRVKATAAGADGGSEDENAAVLFEALAQEASDEGEWMAVWCRSNAHQVSLHEAKNHKRTGWAAAPPFCIALKRPDDDTTGMVKANIKKRARLLSI
jgi:hypothetical protein